MGACHRTARQEVNVGKAGWITTMPGRVVDNENQEKTPDNPRAPKDISTFVPRHQLKTGRQKRSGNFAASEKKVIPWPLSELHRGADPPTANVQIAIADQSYAEELRRLLAEDGRHRAYVVDRPSPTIDGVVVLDEATLHCLAIPEGTAVLRYIVLRKEFFDPHGLWERGVRCVVPAEYPPNLVRTVILGTELSLNIEQSQGSSPTKQVQ
jgi:hypothetical protein